MSAIAPEHPSAAERDPRARRRKKLREVLPLYVAISPFYLLFAVFGLFPILFSIVLSLTDWDGMGDISFVGLAQYQFLLADGRFWNAVGNTFIIWFLSTVPTLFLAMVIAFLLHQNIRFTKFYRVAFFLPNVTSMVAMAIVFGSVFSDTFGLVNSALTALGLDTVPWLSSPWGIKLTIAMMVIWRFTGYNAIIYLAGLQSIPTDMYDAAKVDGASMRQVFFRITVPMLRPIILFTVITSTIGGLSLFTEPQVLLGNSGGAGEAGMTIVLYQYNQAFTQFDFGYGSAIAWALFLIAAVFAIINWRLVSGRGDDAAPRISRKKEARR
ncbi:MULTISPECIES: carbohydrate ABC transporter permease [Brachybacterium]|uniref:carbohydrate ABC transporter permease n=1 Tax=Brachybacterium TaxID=43668 RepID=UPI000DF41E84|nr:MULTISPECIES: sugar ABC transporter permease [Brachybacterium]RCS64262.1 sugar ABC transporter permease [Brachybacterium sp. JB7]RCS72060.1 sugar ABC transporter permease [Brachybacterium alimentarium]RCS77602.1 sugar ABC transporter permease [Brachybacterium alimentarium]